MRLLKLEDDGELSLTEWRRSYLDLVEDTGKTKPGYSKIHFCRKQAADDNLQYFWVDTCCIDKSSSAELSEAINSMFRWYHDAVKCYVYLSDVSVGGSIGNDLSSQRTWDWAFQRSRWFTRGWTLQELIAPTSVEFFSEEGERLGDKNSPVHEIHKRTGINVRALEGSLLSQFIFDIQIPLLYGEGRKKALVRLQKGIKESSIEEGSTVPQAGADTQYRANSVYSGPVFNGPVSGRYVIPGMQVTRGTVNYNFTG